MRIESSPQQHAVWLATIPAFATLSHPTRTILAGQTIIDQYPTNTTLHQQGDHSDQLLVLLDGAAARFAVTTDHHEWLWDVVHAPAVLGELSLDGGPQPLSCVARGPVRVMTIPHTSLTQLTPTELVTVTTALHRLLLAQQRRLLQRAMDLALLPVTGRVAGLLLDLTGESTVQGCTLQLPYSQTEIAQMVGSCRKSVNQAFRGLQQRRVIHREESTVTILDPELLRVRARRDRSTRPVPIPQAS